ncbi:MAG: glycosyltransferase [Clostridia bacterium]|nr:glycosyltransferase [Clostridia bacterium]
MKILIVCDVLGEENNGTTIAAMNLIRFLKQRGHEVRILCADQDKKGTENVFVVPNLSLGRLLNAYVARVGVTLAKADEGVIRAALAGVDHVHIMLPFPLGKKALRLAREAALPVTAGFHMQAENFTSYIKLNKCEPLNRGIYRYIYKHFYKYVDGIHYPTAFIRDIFESTVGHTTNGYVISNGVHSYVARRRCEKPDALWDKTVILTTGRYAREKSQDTLIKAVGYSRHRDNIQLILGGQGVKEGYYRRLAKRLPIPPIFKFYSREEIIDVLNYADIYVHPAEAELEGISCLEAVVCGKLTVVSDSKRAATKDFAIDESCIFKNRDPRSLARVIDYWIEHPEKRAEYEKKYLESAVAFRQDACMLRMEEMMQETVNEKRSKNDILRG